jgi:WhiB family redox-sensing transcriptional regulator
MGSEDWDIANCYGMDTEIFFPDPRSHNSKDTWMVKKICNTCPIKQQCLDWGLKYERHGIWGGATAGERQRMRIALKIKPKWDEWVA